MPADPRDPLGEARSFLANTPENPPWQEANLVESSGGYGFSLPLTFGEAFERLEGWRVLATERAGRLEPGESHFSLTLVADSYDEQEPLDIQEAIDETNLQPLHACVSGVVFGLSLRHRAERSAMVHISRVNGDGLRQICCMVCAGDLEGQNAAIVSSELHASNGVMVERCPPLKIMRGLAAEQARAFSCMPARVQGMQFGPLELAREHLTELARKASRLPEHDEIEMLERVHLLADCRGGRQRQTVIEPAEGNPWSATDEEELLADELPDGMEDEQERLYWYHRSLALYHRAPLVARAMDARALALSWLSSDDRGNEAVRTMAVDWRGLAISHTRTLKSGRESFELEDGPLTMTLLRACGWGSTA